MLTRIGQCDLAFSLMLLHGRYPLLAVRNHDWDPKKPYVLITGGVHGYETSGVQGAIRFLQTQARNYSDQFNILVAPCVSPWGYETVQRWNAAAVTAGLRLGVRVRVRNATAVTASRLHYVVPACHHGAVLCDHTLKTYHTCYRDP